MNSTEPAATTAPISGQNQPSSSVEPTSMTTDGSSAIRIVSLSRSSAHMPRVILRTVDPAKLLACQSVEKRWTRWKASAAISAIIFRVSSTMAMKARLRSTTPVSASATSIEKAAIAAFQATSSAAALLATASTSRPE